MKGSSWLSTPRTRRTASAQLGMPPSPARKRRTPGVRISGRPRAHPAPASVPPLQAFASLPAPGPHRGSTSSRPKPLPTRAPKPPPRLPPKSSPKTSKSSATSQSFQTSGSPWGPGPSGRTGSTRTCLRSRPATSSTRRRRNRMGGSPSRGRKASPTASPWLLSPGRVPL